MFSIDCHECDQVVTLTKIGDDYKCEDCGTIYSDEDGVNDAELMADMHALYHGAVIAGLINNDLQEENNYDH